MGKRKQQYIEDLKEYTKSAENKAKYSIERFDVLIISLSSGGIALSISFFENFKEINKANVYTSCFFFAFALVINLLSQVSGFYANHFDIKYVNEEIRELEKKEFDINYKKNDCYKSVFNFITKLFNGMSLTAFIIGVTYLILFVKTLK